MATPIPRKFFGTLDGIRGMAALTIAIWHTALLFGLDMPSHSYLAVDVFFVLSGVVIANAYESQLMEGLLVREFFTIRLIRLYPLYIGGTLCSIFGILSAIWLFFAIRLVRIYPLFIAATLCLIVILILPGIGTKASAQAIVIIHVCLAFFFLPNFVASNSDSLAPMFPLNPPAWSLFYEIAANLFYACTIRYLKDWGLIAIMAFTALGLALCISYLPSHNLNIGFTLQTSPAGLFRVGYSFFTGVLLYRLFRSGKFSIRAGENAGNIIPWIILAVIGFLLSFSRFGFITPYYDFICVVIIFPCAIYLALYFESTGPTSSLFKFLGAISYALYIFHVPMYNIFKTMAARLGIDPGGCAPWLGMGFIAFMIGLCWLLDKIYDFPVRLWLSHMAGIRQNEAPQLKR